jgi:hypothetical protein
MKMHRLFAAEEQISVTAVFPAKVEVRYDVAPPGLASPLPDGQQRVEALHALILPRLPGDTVAHSAFTVIPPTPVPPERAPHRSATSSNVDEYWTLTNVKCRLAVSPLKNRVEPPAISLAKPEPNPSLLNRLSAVQNPNHSVAVKLLSRSNFFGCYCAVLELKHGSADTNSVCPMLLFALLNDDLAEVEA